MASSSSSSPELSYPLHTHPPNPYKYSTIEEVLDDLSSRFILNLPDGELASLERICFQVEQAHWYYEDFIREENPKFPSLHLKKFSEMFFQACPLLERWRGDHDGAFDHFMRYKTRVPVCGAIMLNDTWDKVVLVKGWKSSSGWGFPKGKINQNEPSHECAVREVAEETGFNLTGMIDPKHVIEMEIREQQISLFVVPGIPEDFHFETKTRKEISKIEWFRLADLPTWKRNKAVPGKFYLISPFIGPLKSFIAEHKPRKPPRRTQRPKDTRSKQEFPDESDASVIEFQACSTTHLDATAQESSSQTSSGDNGDPQTPSPLYSEAVVSHVVAQTTESNGLNGTSVDPHFARLLSALTLSATSNGTSDGKPDRVPPKSATLPPSSVPPATVADATLNGSTQTREVHPSGTAIVSSRSRPPSKPSSMAVPVNDTYRLGNPSSWSDASSPLPPSQSTVTPGSVNSQSPGSMSPTHSRQSSMITADLSPYLARPAGIPMNGKRLRQLALLEAVADESSRMSLASPTRPVMQSPSPHGASPTPIHAPPPSNTVMSHNFTNLSPMYSNTHGPYVPIPQTGPLNSPSPDNAFVVRPRTSNSFRPLPNPSPRSFNTRGSMNQAQLLNAVSGTPYAYPSTPSLHRSPIPPMPNLNFHSSSSNTFPTPPIPTLMTGAPTFRTGPHPSAHGRVPPPPLPVLSSQTVSGPAVAQVPVSHPGGLSDFAFPPPTANTQNSQLLSILNRGPGQ